MVKLACIALVMAAQSIISVRLMQPASAQSTSIQSSSSSVVEAGGKRSASAVSTVTAVQSDDRLPPSRAPGGYTHYDPRAFIPRQQQPGNVQSTNTTATHQGYNHLNNGYMYLGGADRGTDKDPRLNAQTSATGNQSTSQDASAANQSTAQPGVTQMYDTGAANGKAIRF
jgi:hypothetical protein